MSNLALVIPVEKPNKQGPMGFKEEQKRQRQIVSQTLMEGALQLSAEEGYASLSLRSVARKAGIAPTSFYRHFRDMDELGLALVDQAAELLQPALEKALDAMDYGAPGKNAGPAQIAEALEGVVSPFVECFFEVTAENQNLFRLFFQERTGSSRALRESAAQEFEKSAQALWERMDSLDMDFGDGRETGPALAMAMLNLAAAAAQETICRESDAWPEAKARTARECVFMLLGALLS
ncbi:transcriptional regulator, TetR family [Desulfatibacillum aliphaticivorans]|uniref:Transcriptional regulator, TetR family n=2 Tax=Desulfatibacillum aliphaticivorans TaxID=218208 RepID=B8FEZ6_DESAL|nr:transcriptional regulator, TetR family [Desulfatibacillum aliphaticivorans]